MKINKYKPSLFSLLSTVAVAWSASLHADTTLKQGMEQTLTTNPEILADEAGASASDHAISQARAGYFPTVDVTATAGKEYIKNRYRTNPCAAGVSCTQKKFRTNPSISVTQNLFDGLKTPRNVDKAKAGHVQAQMKVMETRELVAYRFVNAASDVRRFQRLYRLSKDNIAAHEKILGKVNKLIEGGKASIADRQLVSARLHDGKSASVDILNDVQSATAKYKTIAGIEPDRLGSTAIPDSFVPATLDEALAIGRERNRSVILAKAALEVANADLLAAQSAYLPTVGIEADASKAKNTAGRSGYTNNVQVLGVLKYNLFRGGADLSLNDQARERIVQARHRLETAIRSAEEDVRRSWHERESARLQAIDLRKSVSDKDEVRKTFAKQYDLGTRTLIDVVDAENDYFLSKGSLITVDATQDLAEARLLAAMGVLTEKFGLGDKASQFQEAAANLAFANETKDPQEEWLKDTAYMTDEKAEAKFAEAPIANDDWAADSASSGLNAIEEASPPAAAEKPSAGEGQQWAYDTSLPSGSKVYDFDRQVYLKGPEPISSWRNPNDSASYEPKKANEPYDFSQGASSWGTGLFTQE